MVHSIGNKLPDVEKAAFLAWNAEVAGEVTLGPDASVWFGATLRGDLSALRIGAGTNVQDNAVLHVDTDLPLTIGDRVTIGHAAVLHGCTVEDDCLIGMAAVVLNGAVIGRESIVGAGALVTEGKVFPPRSLILGSPAKAVREVDDAMLAKARENTRAYIEHARAAARDYREAPGPGSPAPALPAQSARSAPKPSAP
jgi:carbonic anhydrase/acetyltransferase-like protein (isoleucine patch superfamily)